MRARLLSLLLRPTPRPVALGLVVATLLIAAETLLLYPLEQIAPANALGVVYLLGVLVVAIGWGFWLAAATSVASALAFDYFHVPPVWSFMVAQTEDGVALVIFVVVALLASTLADLARSRAAEAHQRRKEADLAAELTRLMLYAGDLRSTLDRAAQRLAQVFGLPFVALELEAVPADERRCAIPLHDGASQLGTLLVPADLTKPMQQRPRQRVVPSVLRSLVRPARHRAPPGLLEANKSRVRANIRLSESGAGVAVVSRIRSSCGSESGARRARQAQAWPWAHAI
jgi:hypothetical protein